MNSQDLKTPAPFEIQKPDFKTYSFENRVPDEFIAEPGSKLSISYDLYKEGKASLRWDWDREGASFCFKNDQAFKYLTGKNPDPIVYDWVTFCYLSTISMWVFSDKALETPLWFEIGDGKKVDTRFYMNINFDGWRHLKALYGRDFDGFPDQKTANTLRVIAPKGVKNGTLYFDLFGPRMEKDVRWVKASDQMPYVHNKNLTSTQVIPAKAVETSPKKIKIPLPEKLSEKQQNILDGLTEKYLSSFIPDVKKHKFSAKDIDSIFEIYEKYNLNRNGKFVSGNIGQPIRYYAQMTRVARAFLNTKEQAEVHEKLRQLFMDMTDLVIQQGHGAWYGLRTSFVLPVMLMKDELKKAHKYKAYINKISEIIGVHEFYLAGPWGNADDYNTELRGRVAAILMQDDRKQKWRALEALKHWLNYTSSNGEIKPDGTFFHHNMVYTGYNFPAIGPICGILNLTHDTPFFAKKMYKAARKSLLVMSYYSNDYVVHMFSGRWRKCGRFDWSIAKNFALLAECGDPETGIVPDRKAAAEYLYYAKHFNKNTTLAEKYRKLKIAPAEFDGHLSLNYAVSSIHRRDKWMAVMRGMKKGIETNEAYANQGGNTMGRYLNYGQIQIFTKPTPEANGFPQGKHLAKGWNYNFFPGTTARVIPLDALRQHFMNIEATTTEYFAGGTSLDGNGVFGMKLQEELPQTTDPLRLGPPLYWLGDKEYRRRCKLSMYDTSFRARKSMFFFENRIIALGSGITSSDKENIIATTLFQNSLSAKNKNNYKDSAGDQCFPLEKIVTSKNFWMIDSVGNGFYIPQGNPPVKIIRKLVKNPYYINWNPQNPKLHQQIEPNEGEIELAYIDHGKKPQNQTYEYCILIQPDIEKIQEFKTETFYKVLRHDKEAHIVYDIPSRTSGYVMFDGGDTKLKGILKKVDKPCMLMICELENGRIRLSLYNPDFDDYSEFGSPKQYNAPVKITLNGDWKLVDNHTQVRQEKDSAFIVRGKDAVPVIFDLHR